MATAGKTRTLARAAKSATPDTAPDWTESFGRGAESLEREIESVVREQPWAVLGGALALGVAGYFLVKSRAGKPGASKRTKGTSRTTAGIFTGILEPTLKRFHDEFDRIPVDGFSGAAETIRTLVTTELTERPIQSIGAAAAIGFGLGGLDREQFKRGGIRLAKIWALKALDGVSSERQEPQSQGRDGVAKISSPRSATNPTPKGEQPDEYDQDTRH